MFFLEKVYICLQEDYQFSSKVSWLIFLLLAFSSFEFHPSPHGTNGFICAEKSWIGSASRASQTDTVSWLCSLCRHAGSHAQKDPELGLMLCYCCLDILNTFLRYFYLLTLCDWLIDWLINLRERERNTKPLFHPFVHLLVGSCMCPDWVLNRQPWHIGYDAPINWATRPALNNFFNKKLHIFIFHRAAQIM